MSNFHIALQMSLTSKLAAQQKSRGQDGAVFVATPWLLETVLESWQEYNVIIDAFLSET